MEFEIYLLFEIYYLEFMDKSYLKIGNASELSGKDWLLFRALEIIPGVLAWLTLGLVVLLSWLAPVFIAFFIIVFDIYWFLKTTFLSLHLRSSFAQMQKHLKINWLVKAQGVRAYKSWQDVYHLVILPFYKEPYIILEDTFESLLKTNYPKDKFIVVLAREERAGDEDKRKAEAIEKKYKDKFFKILLTCHPKDIDGELAGKGSNETWAGRQAKELIDSLGIAYENVVASVFDIDARVYPDYFGCLAYHFLTAKKPERSSFQPVPVFNNNLWDAPALSRVVASSCSFWQMMQQERPERLATFSSHAMSFKAIVEMDFWNVKNVSEDSRIFWKSLMFYDGDYQVVPLYYPISMDANLAESLWQTVKNVYKQQRRWGWGVENIPYFVYGCLKNKEMPLGVKIRFIFNQFEGFWSWATNALLIFMLGWMPLLLGGEKFNLSVLSYNLPRLTRWIMTFAMVGLISSAFYSIILLPERPAGHPWRKYLYMVLQWVLMPLTIIFFGSIPGLEAQTRLMFGKYMGFWVTPKVRVANSKLRMADGK